MKTAEAMEKMRRIEGRVATDQVLNKLKTKGVSNYVWEMYVSYNGNLLDLQDLKMSDALRYHMHDTVAAKDLLFRRLRCLANYENANKVK